MVADCLVGPSLRNDSAGDARCALWQARQQKIGRARRLYRQALQLEPAEMRCLNGLGALEARAGNHEAALRCSRVLRF